MKKTIHWILTILGLVYLIWICYLCPEARSEEYDTTIQRDSGAGDHHHHVDIPQRVDPLGLGLDIRHDFNFHYGIIMDLGIELQLRNDMQNNEYSSYLVGKIKI